MKQSFFNKVADFTPVTPLKKHPDIYFSKIRGSRPEVFLRKGVLKICSKFTGEHPCRIVISIILLCNFIEIAIQHGCSPVDLLHIFGTPFPKNTSGRLLLKGFDQRFRRTIFRIVFCSTPTFAEHHPTIASKVKYETTIHNSAKCFSSYEKNEKKCFSSHEKKQIIRNLATKTVFK